MNGLPLVLKRTTTGPAGVTGKPVAGDAGGVGEAALKKTAKNTTLCGDRSDQSHANSISSAAGTTRPARAVTSVVKRAERRPGICTGGAVAVYAASRQGD